MEISYLWGGAIIVTALAFAYVAGRRGGSSDIYETFTKYRETSESEISGLREQLKNTSEKLEAMTGEKYKPFLNENGDLVGPLVLYPPTYDGYSEIIYKGARIPATGATPPVILEIYAGYTNLKITYDV